MGKGLVWTGAFLSIWSTHVERFPRESLLESCSREDNGVRGRSAGSVISALLLLLIVVIHILRFVPISTHEESFGTHSLLFFCLFGRRECSKDWEAPQRRSRERGGPGSNSVMESVIRQGAAYPNRWHKPPFVRYYTNKVSHRSKRNAFQDTRSFTLAYNEHNDMHPLTPTLPHHRPTLTYSFKML